MATTQPTDHFRLGLLFAVASAFAFGSSRPFAKSLMEAGWSPTAAVTARLAGGALLMAIFATIVKPDWFREALQHAKTVVAYGLIPTRLIGSGAAWRRYSARSSECSSTLRISRGSISSSKLKTFAASKGLPKARNRSSSFSRASGSASIERR